MEAGYGLVVPKEEEEVGMTPGPLLVPSTLFGSRGTDKHRVERLPTVIWDDGIDGKPSMGAVDICSHYQGSSGQETSKPMVDVLAKPMFAISIRV